MILYLWLLLTLPHDRLVCSMWTNQPPSQVQIVEACGSIDLRAYRLNVMINGLTICAIPADAIQDVIAQCALGTPFDKYRLNIVEPKYQEAICMVKTPEHVAPTAEQITAQCGKPVSDYQLRYMGTREETQKVFTVCKPPAITQPVTIATDENYYLLAGKLIWFGIAKAACEGGYSGVDAETFAATPCGMAGARDKMIAWQNSLDADILAAAREWNVPAPLLKDIIAKETQFWTWTGVDGEHGLIQITDDGAAVVLHTYLEGYYKMDPREQLEARTAWLRQLDCLYCTPQDGIIQARRNMPLYAQALAAYYCMYGSWDEAVRVWNVNHEPLTPTAGIAINGDVFERIATNSDRISR